MLMPSIYGKDLFEDLFDRSFGRPFAGFKADQMMRTDVKDDNIKAKFENGTLKLMIPKRQPTIEEEKKKYIQIEG